MPRPPAVLLALLFALIAPAAAHAQAEVPDTTRIRGRPIEPIAGVRLGYPMKLSGFVGLALVDHRTKDDWSGWSLTVERGFGGAQVGIGKTVGMPFHSTARMQLAVLRTMGDPWLVGPDRTWVGIDDTLTFLHAGFTLSVFARVPGQEFDPKVLIAAGLVVAL
ncbi:MAG TPA: hypothetical protein VFQ45_03650 [Longimicrobium sp.]|nr:hypothetical protein [Longimicrobium sp.]